MKREILSGKDIVKLGYPEGRATGIAVNKEIKNRMSHQEELVKIPGVFTPQIVRMCGDDSSAED